MRRLDDLGMFAALLGVVAAAGCGNGVMASGGPAVPSDRVAPTARRHRYWWRQRHRWHQRHRWRQRHRRHQRHRWQSLTNPASGPPAGNPDGTCAIPADAQLEDISTPRTVVGNGTAASCTGGAFVSAVALGGVITFSCGPDPVTITLDQTAKIFNDTGPKIVIDGGGKITLSGAGKVRILYQDTCDQAQKWTTSHCQDQDSPQLTVQNLTFVDGNSKGQTFEGGGGGAIFARGGRFKVINSRFFNNVCDDVGPDVGGAAIRTLSQSMGLPVYVVNSTFGGQMASATSAPTAAG